MLKPRALTSVLAQANTDGVQSTFLFKQDGTLLAYSAAAGASDPRVVAAISSKIWAVYEKSGLGLAEDLVLCSAPSVPQPVVQSRRRPLLGPSPS